MKRLSAEGWFEKKKGLGRRLVDNFIGEDVGSVKTYVLHDVLIPAAKSTLSDMVSGGIEMLLFGETRSNRRREKGKPYTSYSACYKDNDRDRKDRDKREISSRNRARFNFDDILLDTRGEAEEVLSNLVDLTIDYKMASVSDLYGFLDIEASHTDVKFGWTDLGSAKVVRTRDGYLLDLPKPTPLD